jgi:lipoyl(octanoyl) transferase
VPCGIEGAGVASLESLLDDDVPSIHEVEDAFALEAGQVWQSEVSEALPELRTVSATLRREDGRVLLLQRTAERGGFWQILTGRIERGESPLQTVAREIHEETGFSPRLDELRDLGYAHSFALGDRVPPLFVHETAFAATVSGEPRLSDEHQAHRWCSPAEALALLPFAGLRRAVALATAA